MTQKLKLNETEKEGLRMGIKKDGKKYSVRQSRARIFTPKEWNLFLESFKKGNNKILFDFLINTGARINEALNVKMSDINFKDKLITLRITKTRTPFSNGMPRTIKVSSQFIERLEKEIIGLNKNDLIFNKTKQAVYQVFRNHLKKIGIKDWYNLSLHNIRKTSESWLTYLNVNPFVLSKHFGHDTITAIRYYVQPDLYDSNYKYQARLIMGDLYL